MNNGHVSKTNHIEKTLVGIIRVLVFTGLYKCNTQSCTSLSFAYCCSVLEAAYEYNVQPTCIINTYLYVLVVLVVHAAAGGGGENQQSTVQSEAIRVVCKMWQHA